MVDMNDMMESCLEAMDSIMGGSMTGGMMLSVLFLLLLFIWVIGVSAIGALVFWGVKRLSGMHLDNG